MSKWKWGNKYIDEPPINATFFTYTITHKKTKEFYIGCKSFYSNRKVKLSKKRSLELWSGRGAKPKKELRCAESDWRTYNSSSTLVKSMIAEQGEDAFIFEITQCYYTKTEMMLGEARQIIDNLCNPKCLNQWLKLTLYKKNLDCNK